MEGDKKKHLGDMMQSSCEVLENAEKQMQNCMIKHKLSYPEFTQKFETCSSDIIEARFGFAGWSKMSLAKKSETVNDMPSFKACFQIPQEAKKKLDLNKFCSSEIASFQKAKEQDDQIRMFATKEFDKMHFLQHKDVALLADNNVNTKKEHSHLRGIDNANYKKVFLEEGGIELAGIDAYKHDAPEHSQIDYV